MTLVEMTLAGSMIILLTVVMRSLAIHRLPKGMFGAMWGLAVLRLLVPFRLPSRLSAFGWFASQTPAPEATVAPVQTVLAQTAAVAPLAAPTAQPATSTLPIEVQIWMVGMMLCALGFAFTYVYGLRRFREACPERRQEAQRWISAHPLRRKVRLMCTDRVSVPLTYGLFRPVILLPKRLDATGEDLEMILCHEWMHVRRIDALRKFLLVLTACVHWFNPLVWVMFILANRDIELGCDEQVLRMNRGDVRRAYAMALIQQEAKKNRPAPLCSHFAQNAIEERITSIMKMKKRSVLTLALAAVLLLATGAAFATSAAESRQEATVVQGNGDLRISNEDYRKNYAIYEPYGLTFNAEDGRLYYQGKKVRCFEDMYPIDDDGNQAGCVMQMPDGEVDVHAVRDLTGPIVRNEDGSFDPSGVLLGLEAATQEEFDARTERNIENYWNTMNVELDLEWWTAEDFAAWIEQQRVELQALIGTENTCWTASEDWFTWDQAHVDATIAEYEEILKFIQDGGRVSRSGWEDGNVLMVSPKGEVGYAETHPEQWDEDSVVQEAVEYPSTYASDGSGAVWAELEPSTCVSSKTGTAVPQAEQASDDTLNPAMFAEYLPFGLSVENNALYFQEQRVRSFSDLYRTDLFRTVSCDHEDPEGTITVRTVREGDKLTGLEVVQ